MYGQFDRVQEFEGDMNQIMSKYQGFDVVTNLTNDINKLVFIVVNRNESRLRDSEKRSYSKSYEETKNLEEVLLSMIKETREEK